MQGTHAAIGVCCFNDGLLAVEFIIGLPILKKRGGRKGYLTEKYSQQRGLSAMHQLTVAYTRSLERRFEACGR